MTGKTGCGAAGRAMTALLCAAALTVYGAAAAQAVPAPAADSSYSDADGTTWYVYTTNRSADIAGQSGDHIQIGSGSGAGPTIYGNVYGASGDAGVSGSAVSVDNSTVARKNRRDTKSGSVYGGFAMNGSVIGTAVNVNSSDVGADIFGGSAKSGDVQDNTVTVAGSSARYIYGGRTDGGSASGNTVTVESSTVSIDISGGTAKSGDAHENVVTATNSTVKSVYGGYASGDSGNALSNEVILENVSVLQDVHGGVALYGSASGNAVTVSSTDVKIYQIYGGAVESGDAENNKVTLGNAEAGFIYGGYSQKSGDVKNNEVTLHGSSADYILAGGLAAGSGDVSGNSLTLENSDSENFAAGGLSMRGNAVGNSVNLSGSRATIVLGAFVAASGDVSGNTAALENSTASSLIGGRTVRGAAVSNGVTVRNSTVAAMCGEDTASQVRRHMIQ